MVMINIHFNLSSDVILSLILTILSLWLVLISILKHPGITYALLHYCDKIQVWVQEINACSKRKAVSQYSVTNLVVTGQYLFIFTIRNVGFLKDYSCVYSQLLMNIIIILPSSLSPSRIISLKRKCWKLGTWIMCKLLNALSFATSIMNISLQVKLVKTIFLGCISLFWHYHKGIYYVSHLKHGYQKLQ